jgi:threonine synthase
MTFASTRDKNRRMSFSAAITDCMPPDGGLYTPAGEDDLRNWILYLNDKTSFQSMAASLTAALIWNEFSPIISEAIAVKAFPFSPVVRRLDDSLYTLELFHGPTGSHKDFGISYLIACLEYVSLMREEKALVAAVCTGADSVSIAHAIKDKKHVAALLLFPQGEMQGFDEADCLWAGGNLLPIEVAGSLEDCHRLIQELFSHRDYVKTYGLTVANSANIGRLFPQTFFYLYAFSRLKGAAPGQIYYALEAENYGDLVSGLYSWRFSLPVHGFITNCTPDLTADGHNRAEVTDAMIPLLERQAANPAYPSSLERLEDIFMANPAVMKGLVFPAPVSSGDAERACQELFMKYGEFVEPGAALAYAAVQKSRALIDGENGVAVLVVRDHPALFAEQIRLWCGEEPQIPENLVQNRRSVLPALRISPRLAELIAILEERKKKTGKFS